VGSGFQCFAQDGSNVAQIDGDAGIPNMQLVAKHSVVTTTLWENYLVASSVSDVIALPSGAQDVVIALHCTSGPAAVLWASTTQFQIIAQGSPGAAVTAYVFARAASSGLNHFQVFSASGALVFDAGLGAMRVRARYASSSTGTMGTLPAGRTYAAVVSAGMSRTFISAGPGTWLRYDLRAGVHFATASANRVDLIGVLFDFEQPVPSGGNIAMSQAQVLIVDVTGY